MKLILIFYQMINDLLVRKIAASCLVLFVFILAQNRNLLAVEAASSSDKSENSASHAQVIDIVNPANGQIIRHMETQEDIDDWQMEKKCEEKRAPIMFIGVPKDNASALEDRLAKDSARQIAECIGDGYRKKGKLNKAVEYYNKTIALSKTALGAFLSHKALAEIYEQNQQYDLAIQQLDWMIAHSNEDAKKNLIGEKNNLLASRRSSAAEGAWHGDGERGSQRGG